MGPKAEWTVMVFLNGKSDLAQHALGAFQQMASVGSAGDVNVLVQFGRRKGERGPEPVAWSGVYRFLVRRGMQPSPALALPVAGISQDMGKASALADFVAWCMSCHPARRYALVVWAHGRGWRTMDLSGSQQTMRDRAGLGADFVCRDDETGSVMFNRQVQDELGAVLRGRRLDLLGMDACLMGGLETAYAFRHLCDVFVGSKDDEPDAGWDYGRWLSSLVHAPKAHDARRLGERLVSAFEEAYPRGPSAATLSAINASALDALGCAVNDFSSAALFDLRGQIAPLTAARSACAEFGGLKTTVDLGRFLELCAATEGILPEARAYAERARSVLLDRATLANYQSDEGEQSRSGGLSIYFPRDRAAFAEDPNHDGYVPGNPMYPVEFVETLRWAPFVMAYLIFLGTK